MSLVTFVSIVANPAGKRWGHYRQLKGMVMTPTDRVEFTRQELDAIAWRFLGSEFAGPMYADWPIDRRVDAYVQHHGLTDIFNDGSACRALLERVMANIGPALRNGVLAPNN